MDRREKEKKKERKKELRLFADGGLAAGRPPRNAREGRKIFPEERVEFRDLARSIMFAFSSRLLAAFSHQQKITMRSIRVHRKVEKLSLNLTTKAFELLLKFCLISQA